MGGIMKVSKLEELLSCLKDKDTDIVLDTCSIHDEIKYCSIYDLTLLSIEDKNGKTSIKLGFEEREDKSRKSENRMKSMNPNIVYSEEDI